MNIYISKIIEEITIKSNNNKSQLYLDLQGIIERYTLNLYSKEYDEEYLYIFSQKEYLEIRLTQEDFIYINHFLFYNALGLKEEEEIFFNAKCIKALLYQENIDSICNLIKLYLVYNNDNIISTLLRAIIDIDDMWMNNDSLKYTFEILRNTHLKETRYLVDFIFENYG